MPREAPRDRSCARRERWDRRSFRAERARGLKCRRSNAHCGPIPLLPSSCRVGLTYLHKNSHSNIYPAGGFLKLAPGVVPRGAPRDRSCVRRERWDRRSCRADARGGSRVSTFQCSLRPDPAAAIAQRRGVDGPTQFPFPDDVPGRGRLSAARNLRQGQGGAGGRVPCGTRPPIQRSS